MSIRGLTPDDDELDVGARVRERLTGRLGVLTTEGAGAHEYLVRFDDGSKEWVMDSDLEAAPPA